MLVQMPLSHTSPASHSSTSVGHRGCQRARMGWSWASATLFPLLPMAWSTRAEVSGAGEKHGTLTPLLCGTLCPDDQARCCQEPWATCDSKELRPPHPSSVLTKQSHSALGFLCPNCSPGCSCPSPTCHGCLPSHVNKLPYIFGLTE